MLVWRDDALNDAGPRGDAGDSNGTGQGITLGCTKAPSNPKGLSCSAGPHSTEVQSRIVPQPEPIGTGHCHLWLIGLFSAKKAKKPAAEGARRRKGTFGAGTDPAVGNHQVLPGLRPSTLVSPMETVQGKQQQQFPPLIQP